MTIIGLILFAIPFSTRGLYSFMALTLFGEYLVVRKLCQKKYDMSWTEALYLSVYSAVSYIICYMVK